MSTCLKTTDHLYTQVAESTDCSSSCPPSASSEEFAPEGYLILTFDKAKRAKLKTAIFADVSDCRFADDFDDDEDDNPVEDPEESGGPLWIPSANPSQTTANKSESAGTPSPDSACHTTGTENAALDSSSTCYGEAVWVGETGSATHSAEEFADGRAPVAATSEKNPSQHCLIRTSPLACNTRSPSSALSPVKTSDLGAQRSVVLRYIRPTLAHSDQTSPSSGFSESPTEMNTPSCALSIRSSNPLTTSNSVNGVGVNSRVPSSFQSNLYSRTRFHPSRLGAVDWRHGIHGRNCGKMLRCEACGKYYRNEYSLDHHICLKRKDVWKKGDVPSKIIDGQVVYFCPTCHKPFKWLGNLTRHYYVHTGQRFFKCDICPKEFFSAYQVRRHMNSHTGVRFKCEVCEKPFTCKYACAWHTRQHYTYVE